MINSTVEDLDLRISEIASLLENDLEPDQHFYNVLLQEPEIVLHLIKKNSSVR